jgi:glycosyltransferase involved in cell wall biosynthesis
MPEVAGDAAILVDPYRIEEITEAMSVIVTNESIRSSLIYKGSLMLKKFSWRKCAEETLKVIEMVGNTK